MSGVRSPYKEMGIDAHQVTLQGKARKVKYAPVTTRDKVLMLGHDFSPSAMHTSTRGAADELRWSNTMACRWCGEPKFAVEMTRCAKNKNGRRKHRG